MISNVLKIQELLNTVPNGEISQELVQEIKLMLNSNNILAVHVIEAMIQIRDQK
jgi:hypothetical protein